MLEVLRNPVLIQGINLTEQVIKFDILSSIRFVFSSSKELNWMGQRVIWIFLPFIFPSDLIDPSFAITQPFHVLTVEILLGWVSCELSLEFFLFL